MNAGSKQRWSAVNKLLHSMDRSSLPQSSEAKQLCNTISSFFSNKVRRMKDTIASRLAGLIYNPFIFDGAHRGPKLTEFTLVTVEEVLKQLNTMPAKSSPLDFVPTSVLKRCKRLANMSFSQGRSPTQFKLVQVSPLLKKAGMDVNDPASFRPISNLNRNTIYKIIRDWL